MLTFLARLFGFTPSTVDGAIAGLLKAQADLDTVARNREFSAKDYHDRAADLISRAEQDEAEAARARAVLGKLRAITAE